MKTSVETLRSLLLRLDQRGYKAYRDLQGEYAFPEFQLRIDRVQSDPFAPPSQCRVKIPQTIAHFPPELYNNSSREVALRDYLNRQFCRITQPWSHPRGTGNSGVIEMMQPGQTVLVRTSVLINVIELELRFQIGLPAYGRQIAGREAADLLCDRLPQLIQQIFYSSLKADELQQHIETVEDADHLRTQLPVNNLVAFVANGAILPRRSGVDQRPLTEGIPFQSPPELEVELRGPNRGVVKGMGIPAGVTLIVGGGYHGKSTLLKALELGVYNHIPGDGREFVVTDPTAVKIRAEDGRSIANLDISPFINHLPQSRCCEQPYGTTQQFSTLNASGSTSQSANIIEALEAGTQLLLIDEDTAATNLMIRDRRMQALIAKDKEPITPFLDRVAQLYQEHGVSTILVMGGSGDYFEVADTVIAMIDFEPAEVTATAKSIAQQYPIDRQLEVSHSFGQLPSRSLHCVFKLDPQETSLGKGIKWKVHDRHGIRLNQQEIDLSKVEQLVETGQVRAIATILADLIQSKQPKDLTLADFLDQIMLSLETGKLDQYSTFPRGDLCQFRRFELAAAINRV